MRHAGGDYMGRATFALNAFFLGAQIGLNSSARIDGTPADFTIALRLRRSSRA